jgi:predicted transcriptional regulator
MSDDLINSLRDAVRESGGMSRTAIGKRFSGYGAGEIDAALAALEEREEIWRDLRMTRSATRGWVERWLPDNELVAGSMEYIANQLRRALRDSGGMSRVAIRDLFPHTSVSRVKIGAALAELEADGEIRREERAGTRGRSIEIWMPVR